ncbi:hypothetical protein ELZ88_24140 (plasmid) [Salmonella enterica subsp. enterica serovar Karamoja]|uniref:Uncharacterized protein n=1 Tax=Salmonella enterica subsp. enterica serovar Karamoja TaxID=2500153 RepID=A0A3Q9N082_SALET|nr:hypothetical protein [Salmonella enterica]AZT39638.1 hypothetical protein ELZ88_24140 [Salmonella enterica subsp. enterica serovar Karamoja]AZT44468.1 hypothetical protein EL007_24805 [Salmonella enterica subsp. enterica serovar Karamoja]
MMTDRDVVQALLQEMTDRCSTCGYAFATAMKHFSITTIYTYDKFDPEEAALFDEPLNYGLIVHSPEYPEHGQRHEFTTEEERERFIDELQLLKGAEHA